jgi:NADPH-dependent ferric siderophore reductase
MTVSSKLTSSKLTGLREAVTGAVTGGKSRPMATAKVLRTENLSPTMVRVVMGGPGLADFTPNTYTDAYVKIVFPRPGVAYPQPLDLKTIRETMPAADWPQQRTYTVRAWNAQARELTVDFVVHGDSGLAGPWARTAGPGDEVTLLGPGGGYQPDETPEQIQNLTTPKGVVLHWVHAGDQPLAPTLVAAVAGLTFPAGTVHSFVHGEAGLVKDLRRLLKIERGIPLSQLSISGYWRQGSTDEAWRAAKTVWNQEIEAAETSSPVS